jgi:hypothetical protein
MLRTPSVVLIAILVIAGCRNPDVREEPFSEAPDTAAVAEPLYDPAEAQPGDLPGTAQGAAEIEARRTMLQDPSVREAQVVFVRDTVRVTAVLTEAGAAEAAIKAQQFVVEAFRQIERPGTTPGPDPLGPSRYAYFVSLRDLEGEILFEGVKGPGDREIREENLGMETPAGS